jgi:predicted nucleic-acid-binding protein
MIAIDTNVIVRVLIGDDPVQSSLARSLVENEQVFVPVTVALETDWVLRSTYGFDGGRVCRAIRAFGGLPGVTIEDAEAVARSLDLAEGGMDFADALHLARSSHCAAFATFDRRLKRSAQAAGLANVKEP